jgi:photosystem II stability/assembly factor-like uncharacterized protein
VQQDWRVRQSPIEDDLHNLCFFGDRGWIVAHSTGAVLRSLDGGDSWHLSARVKPGYLESITFLDQEHGWICGEEGRIYESTDGGETWRLTQLSEQLALSSIGFFDAQNGLVVGMDLEHRRVVALHTSDGGKSWQPHSDTVPGMGFSDSLLLLSSHRACVGGVGVIARTEDRGRSWLITEIGHRVMFRGLYLDQHGNGWAVGSKGIVCRTDDGGQSWHERPRFTSSLLRSIVFVDEQHGFIAGDQGQGTESLWITADSGESWSPSGSGLPDMHRLAHHAGRLWAVGDGGTIVSLEVAGVIAPKPR